MAGCDHVSPADMKVTVYKQVELEGSIPLGEGVRLTTVDMLLLSGRCCNS